ncbi:MAG: hypothetical protein ACK6DC_07990, partial [Planctomycetota bacterium]
AVCVCKNRAKPSAEAANERKSHGTLKENRNCEAKHKGCDPSIVFGRTRGASCSARGSYHSRRRLERFKTASQEKFLKFILLVSIVKVREG